MCNLGQRLVRSELFILAAKRHFFAGKTKAEHPTYFMVCLSLGAPSSPSFGTPAFGATTFGGQRSGSRAAPYAATNDPDTSAGQTGKFISISAMPVYKSRSPEELRWEDYLAKDKGILWIVASVRPL